MLREAAPGLRSPNAHEVIILERFAALVRAQVLEEAAQVCDEEAEFRRARREEPIAAIACAAAIRGMKSDSGHSTARAGVASTAPLPSSDGPKELGLQQHRYGDPSDLSEPVDYTGGDVTWCWHQINDSDVRYVRADLAAPSRRSVAGDQTPNVQAESAAHLPVRLLTGKEQ